MASKPFGRLASCAIGALMLAAPNMRLCTGVDTAARALVGTACVCAAAAITITAVVALICPNQWDLAATPTRRCRA